jgi:hypothetical protein
MKDTITLKELRQTDLYRKEQTRHLRELLKQKTPIDEPAAWINKDEKEGWLNWDKNTAMPINIPLYTHQAKTLIDEVQEVLVDVIRLLESQRIWNGMDWHYNLIPPFSYLPVAEKVKAILRKAQEK